MEDGYRHVYEILISLPLTKWTLTNLRSKIVEIIIECWAKGSSPNFASDIKGDDAKACKFTKSTIPPWVFFTFFEIAQMGPNCAKHLI